MDLKDILSQEVSSGNKGKIVNVEYDTKTADLTQQPSSTKSLAARLPYVQRAIYYAEKAGWSIMDDNFKRILMAREGENGKFVLSLREADIALRKQMNLKSILLMSAMRVFGSMITEDDQYLSNGVFQLRARFNNGINWRKTKSSMASAADVQKAEDKIAELVQALADLGLPLHTEELEDGFDREFMKPEWMNWTQFNHAMANATRTKPMLIDPSEGQS